MVSFSTSQWRCFERVLGTNPARHVYAEIVGHGCAHSSLLANQLCYLTKRTIALFQNCTWHGTFLFGAVCRSSDVHSGTERINTSLRRTCILEGLLSMEPNLSNLSKALVSVPSVTGFVTYCILAKPVLAIASGLHTICRLPCPQLRTRRVFEKRLQGLLVHTY